jgi:isopenicillin N synthase-like dioxygenase
MTPGGGTAVAACLPVLDLQRLQAGLAERTAFLHDLRDAAREIGFFYLSGHGVPPALAHRVQTEARRFFALPEAAKLAVSMIHSPHFRGYNRAGQELTRGLPDWREQFDIDAEHAPIPQAEGTPPWTRLLGPNLWPSSQPALREVLLEWQAALTGVAIQLLEAFAEALGQPRHALAPLYAEAPRQTMKIIRYPGHNPTQCGDDQGVGAHKDSELLTLLLQDEVGGLQVWQEARWIDAIPRPGTFVVNIGELLELASDGYLRATLHRVVSPPAGQERLSVAFFLGARLDATVPLLPLAPALAAMALGPASDVHNPLFREVGLNTLKGRLRSHPDVALRHHPDLVANR